MTDQQVLEPEAVKELKELLPELRNRLQMAWLLLKDLKTARMATVIAIA